MLWAPFYVLQYNFTWKILMPAKIQLYNYKLLTYPWWYSFTKYLFSVLSCSRHHAKFWGYSSKLLYQWIFRLLMICLLYATLHWTSNTAAYVFAYLLNFLLQISSWLVHGFVHFEVWSIFIAFYWKYQMMPVFQHSNDNIFYWLSSLQMW